MSERLQGTGAARHPVLAALRSNANRAAVPVDPEMTQNLSYRDCPKGTLDYAIPYLCLRAMALTKTSRPFDTVRPRRKVIRCPNNGAVAITIQRDGISNCRFTDGDGLATRQSPCFAAPKRLIHRNHQMCQG